MHNISIHGSVTHIDNRSARKDVAPTNGFAAHVNNTNICKDGSSGSCFMFHIKSPLHLYFHLQSPLNVDKDENISSVDNLIFAIATKIHLYKHYEWIAMIQRVFEHALFSRPKVQMHKDLKIGQRPWNWQQYALWHYTWSLFMIYPLWNRVQKCSRVNTQCREWNCITIMGLETCNGFYKKWKTCIFTNFVIETQVLWKWLHE